MRMDLPPFNGQMHIEEFLDWITEVEKFFNCTDIPEKIKINLVALRLKGECLYGRRDENEPCKIPEMTSVYLG